VAIAKKKGKKLLPIKKRSPGKNEPRGEKGAGPVPLKEEAFTFMGLHVGGGALKKGGEGDSFEQGSIPTSRQEDSMWPRKA